MIELAVDVETVALTDIVAVAPETRLTVANTLPEPEAGAQIDGAEAVHVQVAAVSPEGRLSETVAPTTSDGPLFVTTTV